MSIRTGVRGAGEGDSLINKRDFLTSHDRYEGSDPVQFSLSANLQRRHLNAGQRAVVALKVRELLQPTAKERQREAGGDRKSEAVRSVSPDLGEAIKEPAKAPTPLPAEERKTTAQ
jgi:hypothetical protein